MKAYRLFQTSGEYESEVSETLLTYLDKQKAEYHQKTLQEYEEKIIIGVKMFRKANSINGLNKNKPYDLSVLLQEIKELKNNRQFENDEDYVFFEIEELELI